MLETYVSTDIETDGPIAGRHSMLSLGSAAYAPDGILIDTFSANLEPLPEAVADAKAMAWWKTQETAWACCRKDAEPPGEVMARYLAWLKALPGKPVFVAYPSAFDFPFVYWYLLEFTAENPFGYSAIDIKTYAMALLQRPYRLCGKRSMPAEWIGPSAHTHVAIDDAIEQGRIFCNMMTRGSRR